MQLSSSVFVPGSVSCTGNDCEIIDVDGNSVSVPLDQLAQKMGEMILDGVEELRRLANERATKGEDYEFLPELDENIRKLQAFLKELLLHLAYSDTMTQELACAIYHMLEQLYNEYLPSYDDSPSQVQDIISDILHSLAVFQARCLYGEWPGNLFSE